MDKPISGFYVGAKTKFVRESLDDRYVFDIFELTEKHNYWLFTNSCRQHDFVVGPFQTLEMAEYFINNDSLSVNEIMRRFGGKKK